MLGPWEKYQTEETGPWSQYGDSAGVEDTKQALPAPSVSDWFTRVLPNRVVENVKGVYNLATGQAGVPVIDLPKKGLQVASGLIIKGVQALNPDVQLTEHGKQNVAAAEPIINAASDPMGTLSKIPRGMYEYSPDILASILPGQQGLRAAGLTRTAELLASPVKAVTAVGKKIATAEKQAVAKSVPIAEIDKQISLVAREGIAKGIRPQVQGKKTHAGGEKYYDNGETAVQNIIRNKDNITLTDKNGFEVTGKLPESLNDFSSAIAQEKANFFKQFDLQQRQAGAKGASSSLDGAFAELDSLVSGTHLPEIQQYAANRLEWLKGEISKNGGALTPDQIQTLLAEINPKTKAYYANPTYETATSASIDNLIANQLRAAQKEIVESYTGPGYMEARRNYGSLRAIEDDVNRRAIVDARKNAKGFFDMSDMWTAADVARSLTNPVALAEAGARLAAKRYIKFLNDPNNIVKNMFKQTEKLMTKREAIAAFDEAMKGSQKGERAKALLPANPVYSDLAMEVTPPGAANAGMSMKDILYSQANIATDPYGRVIFDKTVGRPPVPGQFALPPANITPQAGLNVGLTNAQAEAEALRQALAQKGGLFPKSNIPRSTIEYRETNTPMVAPKAVREKSQVRVTKKKKG